MTQNSPKILYISALAALTIEIAFLTALNWHPSAKPPENIPIEATLLEESPQLKSSQPQSPIPKQEESIGHSTKTTQKPIPEKTQVPITNHVMQVPIQTQPVTHGPISLYAPSPVIPEYLKSQDLKVSVIIEFFITAKGTVTPRLLSSSGNDELDQLALKTAKTWRFQPAQKNNTPTDDKIRLRLNFEIN